MLAINVLIRRQWINNERLTYPLVVLPVEMTARHAPARHRFFADRLLWGGFAVGGGHRHHQRPERAQRGRAGRAADQARSGRPSPRRRWIWLYRFSYGIYPFAVALAFFLPSDLSFSCWFFFLLGQLQFIARRLPRPARGAAGGLPVRGRPGLRAPGWRWPWARWRPAACTWQRVWKLAWARHRARPPTAALYRHAIIGGAICLVVLGAFFMYAGMGVGVMLAFIVIFYLLSIAITRVRAELGTPHEIYYINPQRLLVSAFGARDLGRAAAHRHLRRLLVQPRLPQPPDALPAREHEDGRPHRAGPARARCARSSSRRSRGSSWPTGPTRRSPSARARRPSAWPSSPGSGDESYTRLANWLNSHAGAQRRLDGRRSASARPSSGRLRWLHFNTPLPLHPAGYALANSFAMNYFWSSFLVGWLVKIVVLRYGGRHGHSYAFRFFLGLLLGDYVFGSLWGAIGPLAGIRTYKNFI